MSLLADGVDLTPALERLYGAPLPALRVQKLRGDASTRSYFRITRTDESGVERTPSSLIAMRLPEDALKSDEAAGNEAVSELPFVDVQRLLMGRGLPVPEILVDDTRGRVLLLEDLGDETFGERLTHVPRERWPDLYADAARLLAQLHARCNAGEPTESIAFRRQFDRELLRWELDHFRTWGIERMYGPLAEHASAELDARFECLCDQLVALPQGFVHRDYQSRNLMYAPSGRLTIIDFQDALRGPLVYDLVALLCDSYVDLDAALQAATLDAYAAARSFDDAQTRDLHRAFHLVAVQRKLKDAGRFVFIDQVRGNPSFLPYFGQSLRYAGRAVAALGDEELTRVLRMRVPGFPEAVATPLARTGSAKHWVGR